MGVEGPAPARRALPLAAEGEGLAGALAALPLGLPLAGRAHAPRRKQTREWKL